MPTHVLSGGLTHTLTVAVPNTAAAYAQNDVIGGLLTLTGLVRARVHTAIANEVCLLDEEGQDVLSTVILFDADPSASTTADNGPVAIAAADLDKILGALHIDQYISLGTPSMGYENQPRAIALDPADGTTLYALIVAQSSGTFGGAGVLTLRLSVHQD